MPEYAKNYNDVNQIKIKDHSSLATVGDAFCNAYQMLNEYTSFLTKEELTNKKSPFSNENLNEVGKLLLKEHLFAKNNDLKDTNTKSYATAFEAVIGFLSLLDKKHLIKARHLKL